MNIIFKHLILFLIVLLPGCAKKSPENNIYKSAKNSKVYKLKAEGIECKLCASLSVKALESLPEVNKAEFICLDKDFKNYFINLYLKNINKNPSIKNLKDTLKKEGFELTSISGDFTGEYSKDLDKFKLAQTNEEFKLSATLFTAAKKEAGKQFNLMGELMLDKNSGEFKFKA